MPQYFMLTSSACITCSILSDSFALKFVHTRQAPGQDSQVTRHDEAAFFFFFFDPAAFFRMQCKLLPARMGRTAYTSYAA